MYEVSVREHFDAAHYLRGYEGKCENLHGHRYEVIVTVRVQDLDDIGLSYDFTVLKGHLREVLAPFDHVCLNDISPFDKINPSSENIAATICEELQRRGLSVFSVQVYESPDSSITFVPGNLF